MPQPSSITRTSEIPPRRITTSILRAPASMLFSVNSFTTDAGRSTTSPAATWLATVSDSNRIWPILYLKVVHASRLQNPEQARGMRYSLRARNRQLIPEVGQCDSELDFPIPTAKENSWCLDGSPKTPLRTADSTAHRARRWL